MKITDFKVIVICPDHNELYHHRKVMTHELLEKMGFKDIIHYKSGTEDYPNCLRIANIEILKKYIDEPILIVEDDLGYTGFDSIEFEEDTDAYYLGYCRFAGHPCENLHLGDAKFVLHSDTLVRVVNTLTTHAILYLSRKYKEAVITLLSKSLDEPLHQDILMSRIQNDYKILAPKKPIFFQSKRFGAPEECTNFTINDDLTFGPPQEEVILN